MNDVEIPLAEQVDELLQTPWVVARADLRPHVLEQDDLETGLLRLSQKRTARGGQDGHRMLVAVERQCASQSDATSAGDEARDHHCDPQFRNRPGTARPLMRRWAQASSRSREVIQRGVGARGRFDLRRLIR